MNSFMKYIFALLALSFFSSQNTIAADINSSLPGSYSGRTPGFIGIGSQACKITIQFLENRGDSVSNDNTCGVIIQDNFGETNGQQPIADYFECSKFPSNEIATDNAQVFKGISQQSRLVFRGSNLIVVKFTASTDAFLGLSSRTISCGNLTKIKSP
jgi:hypothetical protein